MSYAEELVLHGSELYEKVIIEISIPKMERIVERDYYFTRQLQKALSCPVERKNLKTWYGTKILFLGTNQDDKTIYVDGEVVYRDRDQIKGEAPITAQQYMSEMATDSYQLIKGNGVIAVNESTKETKAPVVEKDLSAVAQTKATKCGEAIVLLKDKNVVLS